jgi:secreted trypsin-like serine protease
MKTCWVNFSLLLLIFNNIANFGTTATANSTNWTAIPPLQNQKQQDTVRTLIYGGKEVNRGRYPYLVALFQEKVGGVERTGGLEQMCGGSLVSPTTILTAAHCFHDIDVAMLGVHNYTNIADSSASGTPYYYERYKISTQQKLLYPYYNSTTQDGDFLLIFLDKPSQFQPIALNINTEAPSSDKEKLTVMGWGDQETGVRSYVPKETSLDVRTNFWCKLAYQHMDMPEKVTDTMICAEGGSKRDSCKGDSGGPLIVKGSSASDDVLVGVVSWGYGCAEAVSVILPGVYARVSSAIPWIKQHVSEVSYINVTATATTNNSTGTNKRNCRWYNLFCR